VNVSVLRKRSVVRLNSRMTAANTTSRPAISPLVDDVAPDAPAFWPNRRDEIVVIVWLLRVSIP
jgi:hypothetical protein